MGEAVFFIFLKDGKVLLEHRTDVSEEPGKIFLPCGGIEEVDRTGSEDYRVVAMKREIREELGEAISVNTYTYLTTAESAEKLKMYHSYVITSWDGTLPDYSMENGQQNAKLVWTKLADAFLEIDSDVARTTVGKLLADIRNGNIEI